MRQDQENETTTIRRRTDGSIDTEYYLARGRRERSKTAHEATGRARRLIADWLQAVRLIGRGDAVRSAG